jgi:hypothetical protein
MGKRMITGLILILSLVYAEEVMYEGLRVDMSALTLNRDILSCITPAMNRTLNYTFKSLSEHGALSSLYIKDIKITKPVIDENLFDMYHYTYNAPIYQFNGTAGCIYFQLSFSYSMTFLGFTVSSGTGSGLVKNEAKKIYVFFNETHPDIQLPHPWDVTSIKLTSRLISPKKWIEELLESKFIYEFHKVVDDAMFDFADKLLHTYEYIEDVFDDDYDLVFTNSILQVKPTVDNSYISIGFETNITVRNHYQRKMYRRITGSVVPLGDFSFCLSAEILPDSLDVLGKAGYHELDYPPIFWDFDNNTVSTLFTIMPALSKTYSGDEEYVISIRVSSQETINDITQRGSAYTYLEMQYPFFCQFRILESGDTPLIVNVYSRFMYLMNGTNQTYNADIGTVELYGFSEYPSLPDAKKMVLSGHVHSFVKIFEHKSVLAPGVKVVPNRKDQLKFVNYYAAKEEICFGYNEER